MVVLALIFMISNSSVSSNSSGAARFGNSFGGSSDSSNSGGGSINGCGWVMCRSSSVSGSVGSVSIDFNDQE